MRTLAALVFNHSLNGLLADRGTDFWTFCFDLLDEQGGPDHDDLTLEFLQSAHRTSWAAPRTRAWLPTCRPRPTTRGHPS
jgi:hypothetical protein